MSDRNFSETAEQEDFAHENIGKRELGIGKIVLLTGEQKGYIKHYGNSARTLSKAVFSVDFALLSDR